MALAPLLAAAAMSAVPAQLAFLDEAVLSPGPVTLGRLADLSALPPGLRQRADNLVLVVLPAGRPHLGIEHARMAERARGMLPALGPWLSAPQPGRTQVRLEPQAPCALAAQSCRRTTEPVIAGETPTLLQIEPAACAAQAANDAFAFSTQDGLARARRDLEPGALLADPPIGAFAGLPAGASARLVAQVGPVRIERSVDVVGASRAGQPVFVRASDGTVFAAPAGSLKP